MSDTPETDAAVIASDGQWSYILRECSQNLERERDDARSYLKTAISIILFLGNQLKQEPEEGEESDSTCVECGYPLQEVRPGKHQCNYCDLENWYEQAIIERENAWIEAERLRNNIEKKDTFNVLKEKVVAWARDRQIIQNGTSTSQLLKAVSEMGELADAHAKHDTSATVDALGDVLVCLINYAEIENLNLVKCLAVAYDQIKDRKGYLTKEGTFVKEG